MKTSRLQPIATLLVAALLSGTGPAPAFALRQRNAGMEESPVKPELRQALGADAQPNSRVVAPTTGLEEGIVRKLLRSWLAGENQVLASLIVAEQIKLIDPKAHRRKQVVVNAASEVLLEQDHMAVLRAIQAELQPKGILAPRHTTHPPQATYPPGIMVALAGLTLRIARAHPRDLKLLETARGVVAKLYERPLPGSDFEERDAQVAIASSDERIGELIDSARGSSAPAGLEENSAREEVAHELGVPVDDSSTRAKLLASAAVSAPHAYATALGYSARLFINAHRARAIVPPVSATQQPPSPTTPFGQSTAGLEEDTLHWLSRLLLSPDYETELRRVQSQLPAGSLTAMKSIDTATLSISHAHADLLEPLRLAIAHGDGVIRLWDLAGAQRIRQELKGAHTTSITALMFHGDSTLYSGDVGGHLYEWDVHNGTRRGDWPPLTSGITALTTGPEFSILSGTYDGTVTQHWVSYPEGYPDEASASSENTRVGQLSHRSPVQHLVFTRNDKTVTAIGRDGSMAIWPLPGLPATSLWWEGGV